MVDVDHADRVSDITDEPREAFPTLDGLPEQPTDEQRAAAYANMVAAYHHLVLQMRWDRKSEHAERARLLSEMQFLSEHVASLCAEIKSLSSLVGAGK